MIDKILIEAHYLPSLEFFCAISSFRQVMLEKQEYYVKQTYRNRCHLLSSQSTQVLTVPLTEKHGKVAIHEVKIDYHQKWQNNHWRTIETAYRKAPFYEHYSQELKEILFHPHLSIFDLNFNLLSFCLRSMGMEISLSESVTYEKKTRDEIFDLRSQINPKIHYSARPFYKPTPYYQVFGNTFAPNLSIIDLLFCEGPQSARIIAASRKEMNK